MIQRLQTVLLIVAGAFLVASMFFPIFVLRSADLVTVLFAYGIKQVNVAGEVVASHSLLMFMIMPAVAVAMTLFTIIKFKNRQLQMKLCSVNNLFVMAYLAVYVVWGLDTARSMAGEASGQSLGVSLFLIGAAAVLNIVAKWMIRKDDNLVKSVDRIR